MHAGMILPGATRYAIPWGREFWAAIDAARAAGATRVLDIGAGRRPTIDVDDRLGLDRYVGLDASLEELQRAPAGAYDERVVVDAQDAVSHLQGGFDLLIAWQVLEHLADLPQAADTFLRYAVDGGVFVACLSGRHAAYAVANRVLPAGIGGDVVAKLMGRPRDSVFPAHYDHCDEDGLRRAFSHWTHVDVYPLWRGADYFERVPRLRRAYIAYEDWAIRAGRVDLATHYTVVARKGEAR